MLVAFALADGKTRTVPQNVPPEADFPPEESRSLRLGLGRPRHGLVARGFPPLDEPLLWSCIDTLQAIRELPLYYADVWYSEFGRIGEDTTYRSYDADPGIVYLSYASPLTAVITFLHSITSLPGWFDGLAKLIAYVGHMPDLVKTHEADLLTRRVEAEIALGRALADHRVQALQEQLRVADVRLQLVRHGELDHVMDHARELSLGHGGVEG